MNQQSGVKAIKHFFFVTNKLGCLSQPYHPSLTLASKAEAYSMQLDHAEKAHRELKRSSLSAVVLATKIKRFCDVDNRENCTMVMKTECNEVCRWKYHQTFFLSH